MFQCSRIKSAARPYWREFIPMLLGRVGLGALVCVWLVTVGSVTLAAPAPGWMWIWSAEGTRPPETIFFRARFRVDRVPVSAKLLITADDAFSAYLNGRSTPFAQGNDWTTVQEFDVTRLLTVGKNLLCVEVRNNSGPGGLLYKINIRYASGRTQTVISDSRVAALRQVPVDWRNPDLDDFRWPRAVEIAPANGGVWGQLRGAPVRDTSRIIRLWDIRAGGDTNANPYTRSRSVGERMLLSSSVSSPSEMQILAGEGFTLFQSDSDHLSTEERAPGQWNFRDPEAARVTVRKLGLDWCYFPHEAFPPKWYRDSVPFTRIECLEHKQPVEAFSPWEPKWAEFVRQGYTAMAHEFSLNQKTLGPVMALDVGIHGDYGEAGLLSGARVSVPGQKEDWLHRFGNLHDHLGWWCGDALAIADFRTTMLKKYAGLDALNLAWKRTFKSPEEIVYPTRPRGDARQEWLDFVTWYQDGVAHAIELNLGTARKMFPNALLMLPAGFSDEDARGGNDNSLIPKLAAKYRADVRSTHGAFAPFAENAATMLGRLGSASRFYSAPFWTEPPSGLTPEQEVQRIFEDVSEGATGHFDWSGNAIAASDIYYRFGKYLRVEKPIVDVAMFYPARAQKLRTDQGYAPLFAQACSYLRDAANFDIVDDRMVQDGCLSQYRVLALWEGTLADPETLVKIKEWVNDGGVLVAYDFGKVMTFDSDTSWFTDLFGYVQQITPPKVTERFEGTVPPQYRLPIGLPEVADYLGGDWYAPETASAQTYRWTGANATVRLPVDPAKSYVVVIRAVVPPEEVQKSHVVLVNGRQVGQLGSPGDVTYRFVVSSDALDGQSLCTLTLQSEPFQMSEIAPGSTDKRPYGIRIESIALVEQNLEESADAPLPMGSIRRELDLRRLKDDWTRRYGKGLTIYFKANRQLLKGYIEVLRRVIYHLSSIDPGKRDALPIDDAFDGVYATLFTDKALFYNPKDTPVTKTVTIPAATFALWQGIVAVPEETSWKLTLEPHSIGAIYFTPPPQELLFECEKFLELGTLKPLVYSDCSPGKGATCVRIPAGGSISTRIAIDVAGRYTLFTRCLYRSTVEPVDVLVDGKLISPLNATAGQTTLSGTLTLSHGTHTLQLRARATPLRADFVLLTNDPTIAGYDFAIRAVPVD